MIGANNIKPIDVNNIESVFEAITKKIVDKIKLIMIYPQIILVLNSSFNIIIPLFV
jgi:hypothetical protein